MKVVQDWVLGWLLMPKLFKGQSYWAVLSWTWVDLQNQLKLGARGLAERGACSCPYRKHTGSSSLPGRSCSQESLDLCSPVAWKLSELVVSLPRPSQLWLSCAESLSPYRNEHLSWPPSPGVQLLSLCCPISTLVVLTIECLSIGSLLGRNLVFSGLGEGVTGTHLFWDQGQDASKCIPFKWDTISSPESGM